jgi:geranylgeranyl diphosphate synthase, type II
MLKRLRAETDVSRPRCLDDLRPHVERGLDRWLNICGKTEPVLDRAMRYSVFSGGKRVRPVLALLSCRVASGQFEAALPAACAVEMIHSYSLIHDDLPCMDDDDLRRGKPTNHRVFGEAVAVITGDALQTLAFHILSDERSGYSAEQALRMVNELARACGAGGMVGGQVLDTGGEVTGVDNLNRLHAMKTGALFQAAVRLGALAGGADATVLRALTDYGREFGLAFQIADDILDVVGDPRKTGRYAGSDVQGERSTYPRLLGMDKSRVLAREAVQRGLDALESLDRSTGDLRELIEYVIRREG